MNDIENSFLKLVEEKILKLYISEELLPWQKRFPDVFYKELFRLNGWDFTVKGIKKRPGVIGTWTNKLVYDELPKGVKDELKNNIIQNAKNCNETFDEFFEHFGKDSIFQKNILYSLIQEKMCQVRISFRC